MHGICTQASSKWKFHSPRSSLGTQISLSEFLRTLLFNPNCESNELSSDVFTINYDQTYDSKLKFMGIKSEMVFQS